MHVESNLALPNYLGLEAGFMKMIKTSRAICCSVCTKL